MRSSPFSEGVEEIFFSKKAILLDRDGTIIIEKNYLSDPTGVELEAGSVAGLLRLQAAGYVLAVVTNQSGIGRGYIKFENAEAVNRRVDELLKEAGVHISGWYICPHAPDDPCNCRKPLPGLALQAESELSIDLKVSYVIGDKLSDVELAKGVGAKGIMVTTGHSGTLKGTCSGEFPLCKDINDAADVILGNK